MNDTGREEKCDSKTMTSTKALVVYLSSKIFLFTTTRVFILIIVLA
jgi:hypothetical protein